MVKHNRSLPKKLDRLSMNRARAEYNQKLRKEKDVKKQAILTASFETHVMESEIDTLSRICEQFVKIGFNSTYLQRANDVVDSAQKAAEVADMAVDAAVKMWEDNAAVLNAATQTKDVKTEIDEFGEKIKNIVFNTDISDIYTQSEYIRRKAYNARDAWSALVNQYTNPAAGGRRRCTRRRHNRRRTHRR